MSAAGHEFLRTFGASLSALAYVTGFFSLFFSIFSSISAVLFFKRIRRENSELGQNEFTPALTVLKPIKGLERGLYECLASFCRQDYPDYKIIFTLCERNDAALPTLKRLQQDFPHTPISIVISDKSIGHNPKINSLAGAQELIDTDVFVMADSDVQVAPDFLRKCAAPFRDSNVGLVSCFYQILHPTNAWERLEAFSVNCQFLPQALTAASHGMAFAMGAAIAVRTKAFNAGGGFARLSDHLAEDFILSRAIAAAGYRVTFSSAMVKSIPYLDRFGDYFYHQERWSRTIRVCQPWGYLGTFLLQGFSLLSLKAVLLGFNALTITLALGILLAKITGATVLSLLAFGSPLGLKTALLSPFGEWLGFLAWFRGWKSTPVIWRGKPYKIGARGKLYPIAENGIGNPRHAQTVKL